jgi:hypothetical protein
MKGTVRGLVYGSPKRMKTSMVASAFPNALWIAGEGANAIHSVCVNEWGFEPIIYEYETKTLHDLYDVLVMLHEHGLAQQYGAVGVDGFTAYCDRTIMHHTDHPRYTDKGKVDNFFPYQQLDDKLRRVTDLALSIGVDLFCVAHEQLPGVSNDSFVQGGPSLGSKKQVIKVPGWFDFNARAIVNSDYPDPWVNGGLFVNNWDPNWVTGDRNGVAWEASPPNIRELLRASETADDLRRVAGLEWQDEIADIVADIVAQGSDDAVQAAVAEGAAAASRYSSSGDRRSNLHIRWALQDGIARGVIRARRNVNMFQKLDLPGKKSKGKTPPPPPAD